jgi:hypothetical protein
LHQTVWYEIGADFSYILCPWKVFRGILLYIGWKKFCGIYFFNFSKHFQSKNFPEFDLYICGKYGNNNYSLTCIYNEKEESLA